MATERMASADAAWLHMDDPTNWMVVNSVLWFDQPLDWAAVGTAIRQRLVAPFPRFRQRVLDPPVTFGRLSGPSWEEDPAFRLSHHLQRHRLPAPGDEAALQRYVSRQVSSPLDRARPLWQAHLLDGYGGGSALLLRTHHAIADGIALVQVLLTLTEPDGEGDDGERLAVVDGPPHHDAPDLVGRAVQAARDAASRASQASARLMDDYRSLMAEPGWPMDLAAEAGGNAAMLRRLGLPLPGGTALRAPLGTEKRVAWSRPIPLASLKRLGRATGSTVNDIMLAAIAGALQRYLGERGPLPSLVRAIVPLNLRPPGAAVPRQLGNRFGLAFVDLPVGAAGARERLARVKRQMDEIKSSAEGPFVYGMLSLMGRTPVQVQRAWVDLFASRADVIVTNVVGPRRRVRLAGTPLRGLVMWVPTSGPLGVGLSIVSYDGAVTLGVAVDAGLVPDCAPLLEAVEAEVAVLRRLGRPGTLSG